MARKELPPEYAVGTEWALLHHRGGDYRMVIIVKATRTQATDNEGNRWFVSGYSDRMVMYGTSSDFHGSPTLIPADDSRLIEIDARAARREALERFNEKASVIPAMVRNHKMGDLAPAAAEATKALEELTELLKLPVEKQAGR